MGARIAIAALLAAFSAGPAYADGYYTPAPLLGERASSLGGAFVGLADDPSAAWYNPAGLASLQSSVFGANLDLYELSFVTRESAVRVGDDAEAVSLSQFVSVPTAFGVAWIWGDGLGAAVSVLVVD